VDGAFVTGGSGFIGGRLVERLVADGVRVRALARSDRAADQVRALGAEPVRGDLGDRAALTEGARGCEVVFHSAAHVADWGPWRDFVRMNVTGTRNVVRAARDAGARRLVHVGTEAALMAGDPLVAADESVPLQPRSPAPYSASKAQAEIEVLTGAGRGLEAVVVRPRFVWGPGDTTLLPSISEQVRAGRFAWIGGGRHLTATTHVDNAVEGLVLAARRGPDRGVWFVTDGPPIAFREMIERMLATAGLAAPKASLPIPIARALMEAGERAGRLTGRRPPLTRFAFWVAHQECTLDIGRARRDLGYAPVTSRDDALAAMARP